MKREEKEETTTPSPHRMPVTIHEDIVSEEEIAKAGDGLTLDLSNVPNRAIGNGYELPSTLTDVDLTHNQIRIIEKLSHLSSLTRLCLRQNIIEQVLL